MWFFPKNTTIKESGILEGFVDFHCHLLPGVDDGIQKMSETLHVLRIWEEYKVKEIWLTPHIMEDYPNQPEDLAIVFEELLRQYHGSIKLHLSAENMMDNIFTQRKEEKKMLPLGHAKNHILVETSYLNPPYGLEQILFDTKVKGYVPILAHPERYQYMNINDYKKLKEKNIKFQLNIPSLIGAYGQTAKQKAEMLLDKEFYEFCGTDTHSLKFVKYFLEGKLANKRIKQVEKIISTNS
ncbi:MAG: capsular biosynthesis protein [Prevotella sp.]|nr:capsular biosynthesis protein [Prevotella sp.]